MRAVTRLSSLAFVVLAVAAFGGRSEPPLARGSAGGAAVDAAAGPNDDARTDGGGASEPSDEAPDDEADDTDEPVDEDRTGDPDDDGDHENADVAGSDGDLGDVDDGSGRVEPMAADAGRHKRPRGGCGSTMVRVQEFCVDRYEAPNRRGAKPLVMQSANDASSWCAAHSKRLCTEDEWIAACEGDDHRPYPYGATHVDDRCNDDRPWKTIHEATLATWPAPEAQAEAKSVYQAAPSGSRRRCVSQAGARDLTGNVEEWVVRTREHANGWPYILIGCYWSGCYGGGKPTCRSTNNAHGPEFRFYETGFRCCRDVHGAGHAKRR